MDIDTSHIDCHFCRYGRGHDVYTLDAVLDWCRGTPGRIFARPENSGSESCYVEVARWSRTRHRWERFAFSKMQDVVFHEPPELKDLTDKDKAVLIARLINKRKPIEYAIVNSLPDWEG